jgi:hypothetical protein
VDDRPVRRALCGGVAASSDGEISVEVVDSVDVDAIVAMETIVVVDETVDTDSTDDVLAMAQAGGTIGGETGAAPALATAPVEAGSCSIAPSTCSSSSSSWIGSKVAGSTHVSRFLPCCLP